jgi:proline iminopeptidase
LLTLVACGGSSDSGVEIVAPVSRVAEVLPENFLEASDGVRLYFEVIGGGESVVLVPMHFLLRDRLATSSLGEGRTLVFYDPRGRGRSDRVVNLSTLNLYQDVDDLEQVRARIGAEMVTLIGLADFGKVAALYALKYPERVERIVQLAPTARDPRRIFPPHLSASDRVQILREGLAEISTLQADGLLESDPQAYCEAEWTVTRRALVVDSALAEEVDSPCAYEREWPVNLRRHFESAGPANQGIVISAEELAAITAPTLVVHAMGDRNVPYGSGREWAFGLQDARLLSPKEAAHFSWIDRPNLVIEAIETFLKQQWPEQSEVVERVDPNVAPDEEV